MLSAERHWENTNQTNYYIYLIKFYLKKKTYVKKSKQLLFYLFIFFHTHTHTQNIDTQGV